MIKGMRTAVNDNSKSVALEEKFAMVSEQLCSVTGKNGADCYSKNGHAVTVLTRQS